MMYNLQGEILRNGLISSLYKISVNVDQWNADIRSFIKTIKKSFIK